MDNYKQRKASINEKAPLRGLGGSQLPDVVA